MGECDIFYRHVIEMGLESKIIIPRKVKVAELMVSMMSPDRFCPLRLRSLLPKAVLLFFQYKV
jgi:hypothetical protein